MHYKKFKCSCGKENVVKVDFLGSGHDEWDGKPSWKSAREIKEGDDEDFDELIEQEHDNLVNGEIETEQDDD